MQTQTITGNTPAIPDIRGACDLYALLLDPSAGHEGRLESRRFLREQLERASRLPHDFPSEPGSLESWMEQKALERGERYAEYLEGRKQGGPRRYFTNKAHALSFLQHVAPTKRVDGAWLYGVLPYWKDPRFHGLVRTYLEELGDGDPDQNHVVLYQRLLADNDCETLPPLSEEHYVGGALQLAFAYNAEHFLPELIGYNLGYEQLPLHLLITAFELAELDIDPYYFTLHVTIDNAGSGHARKALQSVRACMPVAGDSASFWNRVLNGYQLNELGLGTQEIIRGFDLEAEVVQMLERKRMFGQHLHSDYSRFGGHTVNEWLSEPGRMHDFLRTLEARHWIVRNQDPQESRFWRLIDGPKAPMAGVFDGYEKQLLHDWIAGDALPQKTAARRTFHRYRAPAAAQQPEPGQRYVASMDSVNRDDRDEDVNTLRRALLSLGEAQRMRHLIEFMHPSKHPTPAGLLATREFATALGHRQP